MQNTIDFEFAPARWPKKPYCSDDLESGIKIRSLASASKKKYIQPNPPHLRVWSVFDVDRPGAALAWEHGGLPKPNWTSINRKNAHAHLAWGLDVPVLIESLNARQGPIRYLCAVEAAFRERLQADRGYSGLITKNPAHPDWLTIPGPQQFYTLGELAEWVDLPKHLPKRKVEEVGLGRNVILFDWLRHYGYRNIRHYRGDVRNFLHWQSHLNSKALERNAEFRTPLDGREVWHIVKSVSKWMWRRFDLAASDARFSKLQAWRGRNGGVASGISRAAANADKRASARLMKASGKSVRAIAAALAVGKSTVADWVSGEALIRYQPQGKGLKKNE